MQRYSVEQSIIEGEIEVKELFEYTQNNAAQCNKRPWIVA